LREILPLTLEASMAEYFDMDGDDAEFERDPVMLLTPVPLESAAVGGFQFDLDEPFGLEDDTADTDPLGGINPYADV
jgi:hypothetical protein